MKDTKAQQSPTLPAPETPDAESLATPTLPAPETPDAADAEPPSFSERQAALNTQLAQLAADYHVLVADIKADGKYFEGFRKVKETFFRLQALAARNGNQPERKSRSTAPPTDLFVRGTPQANAPAVTRASAPPPTDLFVRGLRSADVVPPKISNPAPPPLFERKAPPPKVAEVRKAKFPVPPDPKRKVLADSETED